MKSLPKLRPTAWDGLVVLFVAVAALGLAVFQWRDGASQGLTAVVTIDGAEADRFAPAELLESPRTYSGGGYTLEVSAAPQGEASALDHVKSGGETGVRVTRSDCPTQDCVHTGTIARSGQSIVCLPARIIIRLEGGAPDPDGVDAVLG
jgi:hypothetical protein